MSVHLADLDAVQDGPVAVARGGQRGLAAMSTVLGVHRRAFVVSCLLAIANQGLQIAATALGAWAVGRALAGGADRTELMAIGAGVLLLVGLRGLAAWWEGYVSHALAFEVLAQVRGWVYRAFVRMAPARLVGRRSGDVVVRAMADTESIEMFYAHTMLYVVAAAVLTPVVELCLLLVDPWVGLAALPGLLLLAAGPFGLRRANQRHGAEIKRRVAEVQNEAADAVAGLREIVVLDTTGRHRARLVQAGRDLARAHLVQGARAGLEQATVALGGLVSLVAVLAVAAQRIASGDLDPVWLPVAVTLGLAVGAPVTTLFGATRQLGVTTAAADRVFDLVAEPEATPDTGTLDVRRPRPVLQLDDVWFRYEDQGGWVLRGVDLSFGPAETVAVVGHSGAGKSTLTHLLLRYWDPQRGTVRLDGTDVRDLPQDTLRRVVAAVPQDTFLFHTSLRENLVLGRPEATDAEIDRAVATAQLTDVVSSLAQGYDTVVGERGARLSGGERQRVALARALLVDAPVLLLDEAVSQLDSIGERALQAALDTTLTGRTVVVVAHRLSTILAADRVVVLEDGRVVGQGRHADLMIGCPAYARLVDAQWSLAGLADEPGRSAGGPSTTNEGAEVLEDPPTT